MANIFKNLKLKIEWERLKRIQKKIKKLKKEKTRRRDVGTSKQVKIS